MLMSLPPQETTITEIKQKIMKIPDASGIVIDGFPRDVGQALSFEDQVSFHFLFFFFLLVKAACPLHPFFFSLEKTNI